MSCLLQAAKNGQFKVSEYLQGLPRGGQTRLSRALHGVCEWCISRLEEEAEELVRDTQLGQL